VYTGVVVVGFVEVVVVERVVDVVVGDVVVGLVVVVVGCVVGLGFLVVVRRLGALCLVLLVAGVAAVLVAGAAWVVVELELVLEPHAARLTARATIAVAVVAPRP
jgi:cytochrome bd-type quinol oxidase subunit 2